MAIKIFIDQGHNPHSVNAGAEGYGLREQDITYQVGVYLADLLRANSNFEVRLSRNTPEEILGVDNTSSLATRVWMANSWPANYFISIHVNALENPARDGTEAYVCSSYSQGYVFGEYMGEDIAELLGTQFRGVFTRPDFYVLRHTAMPAVLMELAYITNEQDAGKLRDAQYEFAYAMYQGILRYFKLT